MNKKRNRNWSEIGIYKRTQELTHQLVAGGGPRCCRSFALPELRALFLVGCFKNPNAVAAFALPPASNFSSSRLQQLSVRANPSLSGTLPPQLANLRSLQVLTVSQNALVGGAVPRGIGELAEKPPLPLVRRRRGGWWTRRVGKREAAEGPGGELGSTMSFPRKKSHRCRWSSPLHLPCRHRDAGAASSCFRLPHANSNEFETMARCFTYRLWSTM
jgi:hypothetical protein